MFDLLKQVLTSWQVIAVTLAILLYVKIVTYVAKRYHRPRSIKIKKMSFMNKKAPEPVTAQENLEELPSSNSNDELGLEEV